MIDLENGERLTCWRHNSAARRLAHDEGRLGAALQGSDLARLSGITLAILSPDRRPARSRWTAPAPATPSTARSSS